MVRLKAYYLDGTTAEADVGAASQVELEEKFGILFTEAFDDGTDKKGNKVREPKGRMSYLYFLTWSALKHSGEQVEDDWQEWLERVKDAGFALDQEGKPKAGAGGNPTQKAQSRGA